MLVSRGPSPAAGRTRRWCRCGGHGSAPTSSPSATERCSPLGRLPDDPAARREAEQLADQIEAFLDGRRMTYGEAGRGLGKHPNALRYAAPTGRVVMRWDGARQPTIWMVPPPAVDPGDARLELARRYLHVFGPATAEAFAEWAGIAPVRGRATFDALAGSLTPVRTPVGDAIDPDRGRGGVPQLPVRRTRGSRRGCSRAATRTSSSREPIGSCSSPILPGAGSSGRRGSGRVPF